jgi:pimeloyl-ACP methyl ester carboxylesterase
MDGGNVKRVVMLGLALVLASVGLVGVASPGGAAVDGDSFRGEDLDLNLRWRSCYEQFTDFTGLNYECATARVPLDYDKLDGGKIPVAMVRIPALGEKKGSLFFNPGGPGGSGVELVLFAGDQLYPAAREHYDYIGFDPRGIQFSNPLLCFGGFNGLIDYLSLGGAYPETPAEVAVTQRADGRLRTQCRNNAGPILSAMSSANVARDMEAMRAAVGDDEMNFVGFSYGTVLGQTYAELFPDRVGRIIIDGVVNLRDWTGDPDGRSDTSLDNRLGSGVGADQTLASAFDLCDSAGPERCALAPDSAAKYQNLFDSIREEPLVVDFGDGFVFELTHKGLINGTLGALYGAFNYEFLFLDLALFVDQLADRESSIEVTAAQRQSVLRSFGPNASLMNDAIGRDFPLPPYPNFEAFAGVTCADTSNPGTYRGWSEAAVTAESEAPYFGLLWHWNNSSCVKWPGKDEDKFKGPYGSETANTVLVMTTRWDPATPFEQAVEANDELANSVLVSVDGWGHVSEGLSSCGTSLAEAYLIDGIVPADGTVCPSDFIPFFDSVFGPGGAPEVDEGTERLRDTIFDVSRKPFVLAEN